MKRFLFLLLPLVFSLASAQTNVLTGNIETFGQAGRTNVTMLLALLSPKNQTAVTNFVSNDNLSAVSDSNGNFYFSNILAGTYFLTAQDSSLTRFKIPVYTNTLGTVTLASLANAGGIPPNPSTNFVTQAQLTASLAGISGGGGTASNSPAVSSNDASILIIPGLLGTGATNYGVGVNGNVALTNNSAKNYTLGGSLTVNGGFNGPVTATSGNVITNFGLAGTLGQQSDYSGSPWGQNESQGHPLFFYFAPYPRHQTGSPDAAEFQITNYFNSLASSGQLATITNEGYYPVFFLDVGWEGRRNFNPGYGVTNLGTLHWDANMFPDGMPWLVQKLRTNGIGTLLSLYGIGTSHYTIASTESGWTISVTGTSPLPYTNGVGPGGLVYTNSGFKACELSGPDMLRWDVNELRWWGCWGFGMNDVNQQPDNIVTTERIVADARNRFFAAPGFNQNPGCSYWNQNLAAINWSQATNGWTATNTTAIYANWIENPPDYISTPPIEFWPYETTTQPGVYGDITRQFHNGVSFENFASPVNGRAFTNITFCWPSTHRTSEGAWWPSAADTSGIALAAAAFDSACWDIDAYTNTTMSSLIVYFQNTTYLSFLTNAFMDGLSAMPQMVYDQGVGQGTVWKKPLSNGDTLIWFSNEATNGWYPSITWDRLGFNTNDWYAVTGSQIFGPVSSWLPCTNKIGMFTNVFLNAGAQFFIRLSKQPDASQLLGTVPTAQLTGNNITNATGFFFPPGGGSSFVNGSANGTSQTNMNHYAGTYNGSGGTNTFTPTTNQFIFAGPVGTAAISNGVYYGLATALTNASGHTLLGTTDSGSGLTSLNASQLSSGTIPTARLPESVVTSIYSNVTTNQQQAYFTASHSIQLGGPGSNGDIDWWNDISGQVEQMLMDGTSGELQFNGPFCLTGIGNKFIGNGGGITNQGYARSLTSTNILWTPTVQADGNTNWSGLITNTPAATITGQLPALNASALTSLNAANVSGVWAAPVVTNFAGSVTFSNLNVPNTTATLALLPSQVPNATQVTNMIAANASGSAANGLYTNVTSGTVSSAVNLTNVANSFTGNGSALTSLNATNIVGLSTNGLVFVPVQYVVGTLYTNTLSNNIVISGVQASPTTALSAGQTSLKFQNGASSYTIFNEVTVGLIGSASGGMTNGMASQAVGPGVTYGWTDTSAGAGNSCSLATTGAGYFYVSQLVANGSQNAVVTNGTTQIVSTALQLTNTANIVSGNGGGLTNLNMSSAIFVPYTINNYSNAFIDPANGNLQAYWPTNNFTLAWTNSGSSVNFSRTVKLELHLTNTYSCVVAATNLYNSGSFTATNNWVNVLVYDFAAGTNMGFIYQLR